MKSKNRHRNTLAAASESAQEWRSSSVSFEFPCWPLQISGLENRTLVTGRNAFFKFFEKI
jgi:hypothetical protein